jgi:ABC-type dipeptide/oligopeptide/nickel transport system permease component
MLRYALRRLLWVVPSVLGVSLVTFFVLSLADPRLARDQLVRETEERERSLDLPLFVNFRPNDVRDRATGAVATIVEAEPGSPEALRAARELGRLGGAALPFVLPELDSLSPPQRQRVAGALEPLARRMGINAATSGGNRSVVAWQRYWDARSVEYREATARSAVRRYAQYGTDTRARDVALLDTFALPSLIELLDTPSSVSDLEVVRRLVDMIAHVTESDDRLGVDASVDDGALAVQRWRRWWMIYRADYVRLTGSDRVAAFALETRYGKWVFEVVVLQLGKDAQGRLLFPELRRRSRVTVSILLLGVALAYLMALPLAALSAWRSGRRLDRAITIASLVPHALSPAVLALGAAKLGGANLPTLAGAMVLALCLVADPLRHQRAAMLPLLQKEWLRAGLARGASPWRAAFVHGARPALNRLVTRFSLEVPLSLTACFVIEHALGLAGLGEATVSAVAARDVSWLMALALCGAASAVAALALNDVALAVTDPRMRQLVTLMRRSGP